MKEILLRGLRILIYVACLAILIVPGNHFLITYLNQAGEYIGIAIVVAAYMIPFAEANEKLGKNIVGDVTSINRDINNSIYTIITESNENNYENVYKLKNEILAYNKKLMELKGVKVEIKEENLNDEINKATKI